jgi:hypothetical protein
VKFSPETKYFRVPMETVHVILVVSGPSLRDPSRHEDWAQEGRRAVGGPEPLQRMCEDACALRMNPGEMHANLVLDEQ